MKNDVTAFKTLTLIFTQATKRNNMNNLPKIRKMRSGGDFMNYGIYIDQKRSFIIALNNIIHEEFLQGNTAKKNVNGSMVANGKQLGVKSNNNIKNFCKSIVAKLEKAHRILIF